LRRATAHRERGAASQLGARHLFSIDQLGREGILAILDRAAELRADPPDPRRFAGRILGLLFFQPSTRTRFGFHAAMARLGGTAIELQETKHQPGMTRPESLTDTIRCVSAYCDAIVLRHPSTAAVEQAMAISASPVINGGSGAEHHPTQALIDLYAIRCRLGHLDRLRVGIAGDVANSRASRSFIQALAWFSPAQLRLMVPAGGFPSGLLPSDLRISPVVTATLDAGGLDLVYMAGFPARSDGASTEPARVALRLTAERAQALEPSAIVLDPLPRIDEIECAVDTLPQACYFEQSAGGLEVRAAVLDTLLSIAGD
jgi:aspartate carbamoyltransferase catalytic subunit